MTKILFVFLYWTLCKLEFIIDKLECVDCRIKYRVARSGLGDHVYENNFKGLKN